MSHTPKSADNKAYTFTYTAEEVSRVVESLRESYGEFYEIFVSDMGIVEFSNSTSFHVFPLAMFLAMESYDILDSFVRTEWIPLEGPSDDEEETEGRKQYTVVDNLGNCVVEAPYDGETLEEAALEVVRTEPGFSVGDEKDPMSALRTRGWRLVRDDSAGEEEDEA